MRPTPAFLLAVLLLLAGCAGGSDGGDDAAGTTAQTPAAPPPSPAADADEEKEEADLSLPGATAAESAPPASAPATDPAEAPAPADGLTAPPTADLPGGRYVEIGAITAVDDAYAVAFTPSNFEPLIGTGPEDYHIHFFWDTVEPENAGTNGPAPGEWFLYDGPSPFTGYTTAERPSDATAMCALVADADHAVTAESGNCVDLP